MATCLRQCWRSSRSFRSCRSERWLFSDLINARRAAGQAADQSWIDAEYCVGGLDFLSALELFSISSVHEGTSALWLMDPCPAVLI